MAESGASPGLAAYVKLARGLFDPERAVASVRIGRGAPVAWSPGSTEDAEVARDYLMGRLVAIAGGTNEMQRNGLSERVLGLPREPSFDRDKPFSQVLRDAKAWTS